MLTLESHNGKFMCSRHIWYMDLFIKSVILKYNVQKLCFIYKNNLYCNSLLFHYLLATFHFCSLSRRFGLISLLWYFCLFGPKVADIYGKFHQISFVHCNNYQIRCLARQPARNKPILLGQTVGSCWKETHLSDRAQWGRWYKQPSGWFLLPVGSASNATVPGGGLRLLICGDRGFESRWGQGFSFLVSVVCCVRSCLCESWSLA